MPTYEITAPDGIVYEVDAPDGASESDAVAHLRSQLSKQPASPQPQTKVARQPEGAGADAGAWALDKAKFLGGRLASAAVSLPGLPADLVGLGLAGADYLAGRKTPTPNPLEAFSGQTIRGAIRDYGSQALSAAGYNTTPEDLTPRDPRNVAEQFAGNVMDFVGYGASPAALTRSGLTSAAAGAAGLTAAQVVAPDNPFIQVAGALLGHRAPEAIATRGKSMFPTLRAALRGKNNDIQDELDAFRRLEAKTGTKAEISPGQLSGEYNGQQILDAFIARSPGGQPGVLRANESQAKLLDDAIEKVSSNPTDKLTVGVPTPTATGSKIIDDLAAYEKKFRDRQTKIEEAFTKAIGADTRTPMRETDKAITTLTARAKADPAIADIIADPYVAKIAEALQKSGGTLSYEAARALKTDIGELMPKASQLAGVKGGQIKLLYGALAKDIEAVAMQSGVGRQWDKYNKWASGQYDRIEKVHNRLTKGREQMPERVADAFMRQDATALKNTMRALSPEGRSMAAGQLLYEMAKSKAAGAAAEDVSTSYQKFLGNILEMKKRGTFDAAFGAPEFAPLRDVVADLEKVSKSALKANKVAHDVSGAATIRGTAIGSVATLAATGQIPAAFGLYAAAFLGPQVAGKLMRSPAYLNWLAYAKQPGVDRKLALQRISMVAASHRDPETREALRRVAEMYQTQIAEEAR